MRKKAITLAAVAVLTIGMAGLAGQSGEDAKFNKFLDSFWDAYFKFFPTEGTIQGFAKYSDRLEDFRSGTIEKFRESLDGFNQEIISKIDRSKLSPDLQLEHEMMMDFMDLEFMKFENLLPWEYDPLYYNMIFLETFRSLFTNNAIAPDVRIKGATERAKDLPKLVNNAKDNLKTPPREHTEVAIKQMPAILDFYRTELPQLSGSSTALQAELGKAIAALEDYQTFLQNELLGKSTGNFRLGESHLRALRMKSEGSLPILEEIVPRSLADYKNIRNAMGAVCLPYFSVMYPDINPDQLATQKGTDAAIGFIIQSVIDKMKGAHPAKDDYFQAIQDTVVNIKDFITQNNLIELPAEDLAIETMPAYYRGLTRMRLVGPGAFQASGPFTFYVAPIPEDLSSEAVDSFLQEHTQFYLNFMTLQKIYPGSFVPSQVTRQGASFLKKMHANKALIKGWPLYLGEMLIFSGFDDYRLRERLIQLKAQLKTVIDFQMDINIHQGSYTKDKVVDYMMRGGFMTQAEAEMRYDEIVLNPCEAALSYIGYQEILEMEKDYKEAMGDAFNKRDFLQKVLSYGPIPLRTIKMKIAQ